QRSNANAVGDIHDTMQDLIIRARLQRANGRADNQIIWETGSTATSPALPFVDLAGFSLDTMNTWLDNIPAHPAPPSPKKVVNDKPALATDACGDNTGGRINESASTTPAAACNVIYRRSSTLR